MSLVIFILYGFPGVRTVVISPRISCLSIKINDSDLNLSFNGNIAFRNPMGSSANDFANLSLSSVQRYEISFFNFGWSKHVNLLILS